MEYHQFIINYLTQPLYTSSVLSVCYVSKYFSLSAFVGTAIPALATMLVCTYTSDCNFECQNILAFNIIYQIDVVSGIYNKNNTQVDCLFDRMQSIMNMSP